MSLNECVAFIGIDWADQQHAVCVIDPQQPKREHLLLDQQPEAIEQWAAQLKQRFGGRKVAVCLEQKRGALIYALMKFDFLVLAPVNPKQLARFREALHPSGGKDDPSDAELLAELVLKHPDSLRPWQPDDAATRKVRLLSEDRRGLVNQRTALTNRLKSCVKQYFPVFLEVGGDRVFGNLACQLLLHYPRLGELQAASDEQLRRFYRDQHCYDSRLVESRLQIIRQARPLTTDPAIVESSVLKAQSLVQQILVLNEAIDRYDAQLDKLMDDHRDAEIFRSLPGAGKAMAPRLLAAMGSDRQRYTDAAEVQRLGGPAPVTRRSGKSVVVHRRWSCNRFLLQTFHEYASHSIHQSDWAKAYYEMKRAKGSQHQAAVRALAFKWIRIIYRCWRDRTCYDELIHLASLIKRESPVLDYLPSTSN